MHQSRGGRPPRVVNRGSSTVGRQSSFIHSNDLFNNGVLLKVVGEKPLNRLVLSYRSRVRGIVTTKGGASRIGKSRKNLTMMITMMMMMITLQMVF